MPSKTIKVGKYMEAYLGQTLVLVISQNNSSKILKYEFGSGTWPRRFLEKELENCKHNPVSQNSRYIHRALGIKPAKAFLNTQRKKGI